MEPSATSKSGSSELLANETNKENIVRWLVEKADILPTRAQLYAGLIIGSGLGSMSKVSKKLAKNDSYLTDIGIDEDDAEEIIAALLREKNAERVEAMKKSVTTIDRSLPSRRMSLNTKSISYQSPMGSPYSTKSLSPQKTPHPSGSTPQRNSLSFTGEKMKDMKYSRRDQLASSKSSPALRSVDDSAVASPSAYLDDASSRRQLARVSEGDDVEDSSSNGNDGPARPSSFRFASSASSVPGGAAGRSKGHRARASMHAITSGVAGAVSAVGAGMRAPEGSPDTASRRKTMMDHVSMRKRTAGSSGDARALLTGSGAPAPPVQIKEGSELHTLCTAIASDLNSAVDYRSESAAVAALKRVYEESKDDMKLYTECLGQSGACKSISTLLATFPQSPEICVCAAKAISILCQYGEDRHCINTENAEVLGAHGTCTSLLRLFSTHDTNPEVLEWTCRAIGKLSYVEGNICLFTKAGACEKVMKLLDEGRDSRTCNEAVYAVRTLAQREATALKMIEMGMCRSLTACLTTHKVDTITCRDTIRAMCMLGGLPEGCVQLGDAGACLALTECMKLNEGSINVTEWGMMALEMMLASESNVTKLLQASVCEVLVNSLNQNVQVPSIARGACRTVQLLASNAIIRSKLGSAGACEVFPRTLSHHLSSPTIAQVSCGAIGTLAADHAENKAKLTAAGACEFVIMTMNKYSNNDVFMKTLPSGFETVVWQACWALRKLAAGGANRKRLETSNACEALYIVCMKHVAVLDVVVQVFRAVNVLTTNKNHSIVARMGFAGVCKSIVRAILKHSSNPIICKLGSEAICHLADCNDNIEKLVSAKACEAVAGMIMTHSSTDEGVAEWCCRAMHKLCSIGDAASTRARNAGGVEAIVWALQRQGKHAGVAEWGTIALNELAANPANRSRMGSSGGCEVAISTTKRHGNVPAICQRGCRVIHFLALDSNNRAWLGASGGCNVVVQALKTHESVHLVSSAACSAIASLACNHEGNNNRLRSGGACEGVVKVMKLHESAASVADHGCHAVYQLCEYAESVRLLVEAGACAQVVKCMLTHSGDQSVQLHAFQALQRLGDAKYPENYSVLMDSNVNTAMITVMRSPTVTDNVDVSVEACRVITNLASHADNRSNLGKAGSCEIIAAIFKQHMSSAEELVVQASRACFQLIGDCTGNAEKLIDAGMCEAFVSCLQIPKYSETTAALVIRCLLILSQCPQGKSLLTEAETFRVFVRHLGKIRGDDAAAASALKLIHSLCHDSTSCALMGVAGACKVVSATVLQYKEFKSTVECGISAMEALCGVGGFADEDNCVRLSIPDTCEALAYALRSYGDDPYIADPAMSVLLHLTLPDANQPSSTSTNTLQSVSATTSKPSTWSMLKNTLLNPKKPASLSIPSMPSLSLTGRTQTRVRSSSITLEELAAKSQIRSRLGAAGVCECIVRSMFSNIDVEETIIKSCEVLRYLTMEEANIEFVARAGGCEVLSSVFKMYAARSEPLVVHACHVIVSLVSVTLKSNSNAITLGGMGTCEVLSMALYVYTVNVETVTVVCRAIVALAEGNLGNQSALGNAGISQAFMNILSAENRSPTSCAAALRATRAVLDGHEENAKKFVLVAKSDALISLLSQNVDNIELVVNVLWLLRTLGPHHTGASDKSPRFSQTLTTDHYGVIVQAIKQHVSGNASICQYGCDTVSSILEPRPNLGTYICTDSDVDRCVYFGEAGIGEVAFTGLTAFGNVEDTLDSCLRTIALLTRSTNSTTMCSSKHTITKSHRNTKAMVEKATHDIVMKIMQKYSSHMSVSRYATFVLANLLVDQPEVQATVGSSNALKVIVKSLIATSADSLGARYGCVYVCRLLGCGDIYRDRLVTAGVCRIVVDTLKKHVTSPLTVEHACMAITSLATGHALAKERLAAAGACEAISEAFSAYSLNERVALETCRSAEALIQDSPAMCAKFSDTSIDELVVGLLQSFGCGDSDYSTAVAELCCRVIGELSLLVAGDSDEGSSKSKRVSLGDISNRRSAKLGGLGAGETVLLVLEKYPSHEAVTHWGCFALLQLARNGINAEKLVSAGVKPVLTRVQQQFSNNTDISEFAQQTLSVLKLSENA